MPEKTCIKRPPYDKSQTPAKYKTNNKSPKPYMLNHNHWLKTASLPGHDRVSRDLLRGTPTLPGVALSHGSPKPQKKNPPTTSVLGLLHLQTCRTQRTLPSFAASSGQTCLLRPQPQPSLYVENVPRAGNPLGSCLSPFTLLGGILPSGPSYCRAGAFSVTVLISLVTIASFPAQVVSLAPISSLNCTLKIFFLPLHLFFFTVDPHKYTMWWLVIMISQTWCYTIEISSPAKGISQLLCHLDLDSQNTDRMQLDSLPVAPSPAPNRILVSLWNPKYQTSTVHIFLSVAFSQVPNRSAH